MLIDFQQTVLQVLQGHAPLTAIVPAGQIASRVRQPARWPAIEIQLEDLSRGKCGQDRGLLAVLIYSKQGPSECWRIEQEVHTRLTALQLNGNILTNTSYRVSGCQRVGSDIIQNSEEVTVLRLEYRLFLVELNPTTQKQ